MLARGTFEGESDKYLKTVKLQKLPHSNSELKEPNTFFLKYKEFHFFHVGKRKNDSQWGKKARGLRLIAYIMKRVSTISMGRTIS